MPIVNKALKWNIRQFEAGVEWRQIPGTASPAPRVSASTFPFWGTQSCDYSMWGCASPSWLAELPRVDKHLDRQQLRPSLDGCFVLSDETSTARTVSSCVESHSLRRIYWRIASKDTTIINLLKQLRAIRVYSICGARFVRSQIPC